MGVGRYSLIALLALATMLLVPASAKAERTRVDWQRGLFIGRGVAVGDLRSPNRQLARVKAERQAKARCRALLLGEVASLRWANAKEEGTARLQEQAKVELAASVFTLNTDFGTDGSVVVEIALPLDALRTLVLGPDELVVGKAEGPDAILIDAQAIGLKPALGYTLSDGTHTYAGPTLFFESEAKARMHAGVGAGAPLLTAKTSKAKDRKSGVIMVEAGALAAILASVPLVAILWKTDK